MGSESGEEVGRDDGLGASSNLELGKDLVLVEGLLLVLGEGSWIGELLGSHVLYMRARRRDRERVCVKRVSCALLWEGEKKEERVRAYVGSVVVVEKEEEIKRRKEKEVEPILIS